MEYSFSLGMLPFSSLNTSKAPWNSVRCSGVKTVTSPTEAMMASHLGLVEPDDSREAFKCLDSATEGQVKTEDLREILNGFKDTLSEDQINNLFLELDPDNVGKVDFRRYKKVFCF